MPIRNLRTKFLVGYWRRISQELGKGDTKFHLTIIGYSNSNFRSGLTLQTIEDDFPFRVSRRLVLANFHHAVDELNSKNSQDTFSVPRYSLFTRLKRIGSISASTKKPFLGIRNGFKAQVSLPSHQSNFPPKIMTGIEDSWVTRKAARSGIFLPQSEDYLEYAIRRGQVSASFIVLSSSVTPLFKRRVTRLLAGWALPLLIDIAAEMQDMDLALSLVDALPAWHHARTFFALKFNDVISFSTPNIFLKSRLNYTDQFAYEPDALNADFYFTPVGEGDFEYFRFARVKTVFIRNGRNLIYKNYLLETDISAIRTNYAHWPHVNWTTGNSNLIATPHVYGGVQLSNSHLFLASNTNWAHFVEDVLPRVLVAEISEGVQLVVTDSKTDSAQMEYLSLISRSPIELLDSDISYSLRDLGFVLYKDLRALAIADQLADRPRLDRKLMQSLRARSVESIEPSNQNGTRVYIVRRGGLFRRITNKVAFEELLRAASFQFVFAEDLSLEQKIHVFNEADLIVGEAGAGLANLYFCREGTRVLEIRPQAMKASQEHVAMVDICGLDYTMALGNPTNIISRVVHGTDSYSVDLDLVSTWLGQINEGRNS